MEVVNKELGSVEFDPEQLDSCKVFLYISGKKKVVGCVIAERIKEGFEIMTLSPGARAGAASLESRSSSATSTIPLSSPSSSQRDTKSLVSTSSPSATKDPVDRSNNNSSRDGNKVNERNIQAPQTYHHDREGGTAIFCSKVPQPVICGINRIWVSSQHRRQRIASRMLDAVRERFIYACKLETKDLAFSQPTGDGKALARQYLGTNRFLVYVE